MFDFDIIIPSKGRPYGSSFVHLENAKIPYVVVVEPSEKELYANALPNASIWILPKLNKGIGYSRQYILQKAPKPFCIMDDDITKLYLRKDGQLKSINIEQFLNHAWKLFCKNTSLGILGCKHSSFAIPSSELTFSTTIAHILFINPQLLHSHQIKYDTSLKVFEDIDILFQCKQKQIPFARINELIYYTTVSGTALQGGVDYSNGKKTKYLEIMEKRYPGWIVNEHKIRSKDNQPLYHIQWNAKKP